MSELRKALKANKNNTYVGFTSGKCGRVMGEDFVGLTIENAYNFLIKKEIYIRNSAFNQDMDCGMMLTDALAHIKLLDGAFGFEIFKAYAKKIGCEFSYDKNGDIVYDEVVAEEYFLKHDVKVLYSVIIDKCAELGYTAVFSDEISYYGTVLDEETLMTVSKFELQSARENDLLKGVMSTFDKEEVVEKRRKM